MSIFSEIREAIENIGAPKPSLEPKSFVVGVTSGLPSVDRATMVEEVVNSLGKGCDYIRLDVESHNHLTERDKLELKALSDSQGVKWAIHGDLYVDLSRAEKTDHEHARYTLKQYIKMAKDLKAIYINFHVSINPTPALQAAVGRTYEEMVDPDGKNISELFFKTEEAQDWYAREQIRGIHRTDIMRHFQVEFQWDEKLSGDQEKYNQKVAEYRAKTDEELLKEYVKDIIKDLKRPGSFDGRVSEWTAYMIVAWSMYKKGDSLWQSIAQGKNPKELIRGEATGKDGKKIESKEGQRMMVDAVAAAYVRGHVKAVLDDLEKTETILAFENPDARGGQMKGEKMYRLMRPIDIYHLLRNIAHPQVKLSIDWEHIAMQGYIPQDEAKNLPNDIAEFVINFDVNSHPSVNHLQHPVERGDVDLYKLLWECRKRGLEGAYLTYEWGGGRKPEERWLESVPALKIMAKMLEADIPPDELPPEFFGLDEGEVELERRILDRNVFKPLEGQLEFPELGAGWLGQKLKERGQIEKWLREEHR